MATGLYVAYWARSGLRIKEGCCLPFLQKV
jgi:hypothetical protein